MTSFDWALAPWLLVMYVIINNHHVDIMLRLLWLLFSLALVITLYNVGTWLVSPEVGVGLAMMANLAIGGEGLKLYKGYRPMGSLIVSSAGLMFGSVLYNIVSHVSFG